ncbi:sporulation protein YqfD [Sulfobacillus harzensis]|uniref:Sporulation protein YqfD n=1 Tax=Sulfobacillus harzensis TaxID=2729629 RepID=A0A7Y0Q2Y2_9FIRM|nr:sporulation protein YqfD [Sulfobacillus harzensis]NMP23012.1 sporulation protein YqfD [Sulfobacillus harzensis]
MTGILVRIFGGWRRVRISGTGAERVISELADRGFRLWHVVRRRDELTALVTEDGFEALVMIAEGTMVEVVPLAQGGLPFRWRQLRRRPFLLAGLVTAMALTWYVTSHIWVVEVTVPNLGPSQRQQLILAAEASGLRLGANRQGLDIPAVRRHMLALLPQYAWIGIHTRGVVANIDALRIVNRPPDHLPSKLVAGQSGKVTQVFVYIGAAEVLPGESVQRGQTLISGVVSGEVPVQPEGAKKPLEQSVLTPAEGQVMADVTYTEKLFQPYRKNVRRPTGQVYVRRFVEWDQSALTEVPNPFPMRFSHYSVTKKVQPLSFAGVRLPVQFIEMVYNDEEERSVPLSRKAAEAYAKRRVEEEIQRKVPKDATRVRQMWRVVPSKRGVSVTLTWVMNRNIAEPPRGTNKT